MKPRRHGAFSSMLRPPLTLAFLGLLFCAGPTAAAWPEWMERTVLDPAWREGLLFNPDERTARAVEDLETDPAKAAQNLETARRLSGNDPLASYNAGTGQLAAQNLEAAAQHLESAVLGAEESETQLASSANYNLGNARFGAQDLPGAIDAYKEALRHNPDFEDAKHNLELSQRLLKEQQQENQDQDQENQDQENQDQQDQDQENQDQQDQENQDQENQDQPDQENQDQEQQDQEQQDQEQEQQDQEQQDQEQQDQEQEQQPQDQNKEQQESPLPQFQDLPDMSAEEAAAILEAIENMERDQRRQEALEAAKTNSGTKKDW